MEMGGVGWGGRSRRRQGPGWLSDRGEGLKLRLGVGCGKRGLSPEPGAQTQHQQDGATTVRPDGLLPSSANPMKPACLQSDKDTSSPWPEPL